VENLGLYRKQEATSIQLITSHWLARRNGERTDNKRKVIRISPKNSHLCSSQTLGEELYVGWLRTEVGGREFILVCVSCRYVVGDKKSTNSRRR
jgi:hypothetical protein